MLPKGLFDLPFLAQAAGGCSASAQAAVADWVARVQAIGGATPSQDTQQGLCEFYDNLDASGLVGKMYSLNAFVPDSLQAARVPFLRAGDDAHWNNDAGGALTDLTINGIKGNGSNFYSTGFSPGSTPASVNNQGWTFYVYQSVLENLSDFGASTGSNPLYGFYGDFAGTLYFQMGDQSANSVSWAQPLYTGFVSGNKVDATHINVYAANSGLAHTLVASTASAVSSPPLAVNIPFFAREDTLHGVFPPTTKRFSFFAAHTGLSATDSLNFYNAIQSLLLRRGGGFI